MTTTTSPHRDSLDLIQASLDDYEAREGAYGPRSREIADRYQDREQLHELVITLAGVAAAIVVATSPRDTYPSKSGWAATGAEALEHFRRTTERAGAE